jgi:hypothetical protein
MFVWDRKHIPLQISNISKKKNMNKCLSHVLSSDCSSGGGSRRSKLTPSWISTPKIRATFRRMH